MSQVLVRMISDYAKQPGKIPSKYFEKFMGMVKKYVNSKKMSDYKVQRSIELLGHPCTDDFLANGFKSLQTTPDGLSGESLELYVNGILESLSQALVDGFTDTFHDNLKFNEKNEVISTNPATPCRNMKCNTALGNQNVNCPVVAGKRRNKKTKQKYKKLKKTLRQNKSKQSA
jgi:hypothetical protein